MERKSGEKREGVKNEEVSKRKTVCEKARKSKET